MNYLYHSKPKDLKGNILYPLNFLKEKHPDIYENQVKKYTGREHITQQRIPTLNCLWNDVLHFSAVHPKEIKEALIQAGRTDDFTMEYYQVDPKILDLANTTVYLYAHQDLKDKMNEGNFAPYNPEELAQFSSMPQSTKDYYKEMIAKGERPLLYHGIPHILYKGNLDLTGIPIITV
ncbi:MAG: hypothetical protein A2754_04190 [Candidatus Magasanikbacteria bacterium RIFCSPHIGHO2_01_FULL_47_8]|uniref:Group-specific protein n=1 Tax=Candidatus Magasanikbacteria bacterium RIFCSPHIGHO2_01_FULL_47_8 TaxID=1798673 RepID=A0A1F6MC57_9BACT|nr:MAG: hypothetical protein A2754_04190 [Candidatus Magasanikbacteria bacterium RIFCSPHIGHO2_01_FULL_47_8]